MESQRPVRRHEGTTYQLEEKIVEQLHVGSYGMKMYNSIAQCSLANLTHQWDIASYPGGYSGT